MEPSDQVRLKSDPSREGIVVALGTRRGAPSCQVAWSRSSAQPSWHPESDLELLPTDVRNHISGTIDGNVIQARNIQGPTIQDK